MGFARPRRAVPVWQVLNPLPHESKLELPNIRFKHLGASVFPGRGFADKDARVLMGNRIGTGVASPTWISRTPVRRIGATFLALIPPPAII